MNLRLFSKSIHQRNIQSLLVVGGFLAYVFGPLILGKFVEATQFVYSHQVLSSLVVAGVVFLYRAIVLKMEISGTEKIIALAFAFLAVADGIYSQTGDTVLDQASYVLPIYIREFCYVSFAIVLSVGMTRLYLKEKKIDKMRALILAVFTLIIAVSSFYLIIYPFYHQPGSAKLFVANGFIYMFFRSYLIAFSLMYVLTENSIPRFLLLFCLGQMFISDVALTYEINVLNNVKTPLDIWFETGWGISVAAMASVALANAKEKFIFGESNEMGIRSIRAAVVILVLFALLMHGVWLHLLGMIHLQDVMGVTHLLTLAYGVWCIANIFSIILSRQILHLNRPSQEKVLGVNWPIAREVDVILVHQAEIRKTLEEKRIKAALGEAATQVAHDIRSPLMALDIALRDTSGLSAERRNLIEQASLRIKAIAEDLLSKSKTSRMAPVRVQVIPDLVSDFSIGSKIMRIVAEKQLTHPHIKIEVTGLDGDIKISGEPSDFERMLSNLIQNAVEALAETEEPIVKLALRQSARQVQLTVMDNGKGIPGEILSRIGEEGFTFGKSSGNGFGVCFAKRKIKEWSGEFQIHSQLGVGTMVTLKFPSSKVQAVARFAE